MTLKIRGNDVCHEGSKASLKKTKPDGTEVREHLLVHFPGSLTKNMPPVFKGSENGVFVFGVSSSFHAHRYIWILTLFNY